MKKIVGLWMHILGACIPAFSQVDTTYIYNTAMPYGTLDLRIAKSATRYYYLKEGVTFSFRESSPGVKTNTYQDMTSWDSSPYLQGNLREKNGNSDSFVMNYRLLPPVGYNPALEDGYPIIMMVHGAGESGNCWDNSCYWSTPSWNPNTNSPPAPTTPTHKLLNNDVNLLHGGSQHLAAVNLAGSKVPDDPTLNPRAFPGFVLFPQALNGWSQTARVEDAIRILRLVMKKYNINPNRVYIHGLSNGGEGVYSALKRAPWLFTAALPMSAINEAGIISNNMTAEVGKIPLWVFQGGQDKNPNPSKTFSIVKAFRDAGASVRYYLYPNLGHGTWNTAYAEPDFFTWMLEKHKTNPHIFFNNPVICNTTQTGVHLGFSKGFLAYQWEKDGQIISGETTSEYIANTPGTYRGRFSRKSTSPAEEQWEPWSDPIEVSEIEPQKPSIAVIGTTHLRGPGLASNDANNTVKLMSSVNADLYNWYKNGTLVNFPLNDADDTVHTATIISSSNNSNGAYTLVIKNSNCPSPPSDPVNLFFNNSAPQNITINAAAVDLKGIAASSSVYLTWNDVVTSETAYELWRRKLGTPDFQFVARAPKDAISFNDTGLEPGTTYEYKLRAINAAGRSGYVPSDNLTTNYQITTSGDPVPPLPPQNLHVTGNTIDAFSLAWDKASDNAGTKEYVIYVNNNPISTGSAATTYTVTGQPMNTLFSVYVVAKDFAGNASPPSNQVQASTYVIGLSYKHSTGAFNNLRDTAITSTWAHPEFTGTVPNFTLTPRTQEDYFNFEFTGYVHVQQEGDYTFRITSDDGSILMLDGDTLVDNDGKHGNITKESAVLHLAAGAHAIDVTYFEYTGGQNLIVQYKGPGIGDGNTYVNIPDAALVSGTYTAPTPPAAPNGLSANGTGLRRVDLAWQFDDTDQTDFEVYRALSSGGSFSMIGRAASISFIDTVALTPGTTYYYKVRTVSSSGASGYTSVASAATLADQEAPSVPGNLQLVIKNHTSAVFSWTTSTDNVAVAGYEIYSNGVLIGTTDLHVYTASGLEPSTNYSFTVKAKDTSGNLSAASVALNITTTATATFYSLASGNLNALTTWKQNPDGTGGSPSSFSESGQVFVITNRTQASPGGNWTVSGNAAKVVVGTGVTLSIMDTLNAVVDVQAGATVNLNATTIPQFGNLSATSTVNFNTYSSIPKKTFGNITLNGTGPKTFADTVTVLGNLVVGNGIALKGEPANASRLTIAGNLTISGAPGITSPDNAIDLRFTANVPHTVTTSGTLYLYGLTVGENSVVTIANQSGPIDIRLGSLNGGGMALANGSMLIAGTNRLRFLHAASANANGQTGRISVNGGGIFVTTSAAQDLNFYFDPANNTIDTLKVDVGSGGNVVLHEPLKVSSLVSVVSGTLNASGNLTLLSTTSGSASVGEIGSAGSITGDVTVQQYLSSAGWNDLSSPVDGITVADWQNYFPVTGSFTGASTGSGLSSDPSLYISSGSSLLAYPPTGGSNQAVIEKARGYHTKLMDASVPVTLSQTGPLYQQAVPLLLVSGSGASDGWNLAGNPYASPIVWGDDDAWTFSGVSHTVAVMQNTSIEGQPVTRYHYYTPALGRAVIAAGQGFWVQSYTSAPSLAITEKAKADTATFTYPRPEDGVSYMVVTLSQGNRSDDAYLLLKENGTDGYDHDVDALKKSNTGLFNLSTWSEQGTFLAVNALPNSFCSKQVSLNIQDVTPGSYSLSFSGMSSIQGMAAMTLKDLFTGSSVPITSSSYNFSITADPASYGANRFQLIFERQALNTGGPIVSASGGCADEDAQVSIANTQLGAQYFALNASNAVISDTLAGNGATIQLIINKALLTPGGNHIRVKVGFPGCSAQMLASETDLNYSPSFDITVPQDQSVCLGEQATLLVSGVPNGGHYVWYDEDGNEITDNQSALLQSAHVWTETAYSVKGVSAGGCQSPLKAIHLYADTLQLPVVIQVSDTLLVQTSGNFQWKKDGDEIAGATLPYIKVTSSGNYSVVATKGNCSKESAPFNYEVNPGCTVDTTTPQVIASAGCGASEVVITITNTQNGATYTALGQDGNPVSESLAGNGSTITLHISTSALAAGDYRLAIKADFAGCTNRVLASQAEFSYTPSFTVGITSQGNQLQTDATGTYQWKRDGSVIDGATASSYVPTVSGNYTVVVKKGSCTVESAGFNFIANPACSIDTTTPQVTPIVNCGADQVQITVSASQNGVLYTAVNSTGDLVSVGVMGNGSTITLRVAASALVYGQNVLFVKADFLGCDSRMLAATAAFQFSPPFNVNVSYIDNVLSTDASGTYQWKLDGETIDSATNATFVPEQSGNYTVVVKQGDCSVESSPVDVVLTSTESGQPGKFDLMVFPVPATPGNLTLRVASPRQDPVFIELIDITGKSVFQHGFDFNAISQSVPLQPAGAVQDGVYIVIATQGNDVVRKRIVIRQ